MENSNEQDKFNENSSENMEQPKYQDEGAAPGIEFKGEELKHRLEDEPESLGLDLDGTNPGATSHPMDEEDAFNDDTFKEGAEEGDQDDPEEADHNTGDQHMKIDEEGTEISSGDQA